MTSVPAPLTVPPADAGDDTPSSTAEAPRPMAVTGTDAHGRPWPVFAHHSEAEMARILDFYDVAWEYEPRTFPILWNLDGDVVESFSPDFHLPELDLYLEMTTLKQRLVRKKNRKLRRLRELYPDIRIKLFYARDFRAMMLKYGRLALADSLSGTLGQVVPERARSLEAIAAEALPAVAFEVQVEPVDASRPAAGSRRRRRIAGGGEAGAMVASGPGGPSVRDEEAGSGR